MSRVLAKSRAWVAIGWTCLLLCTALPLPARAGLLAGATRVVYTEGERERSLMLANTNDYPVLVQTWVDDGSGNPDGAQAPFVVLPAVFRLEPQALQGIRLLYNGDPLPNDRESVFWLNLYEIPPTRPNDNNEARIVLSMNTQLKVFYRPRHLPTTPDQVAAQLQFTVKREAGRLYLLCHNPTPYHASFTELSLIEEGHAYPVDPQPDMMTRPFDSHAYELTASMPPSGFTRIRFTLLDDQGNPKLHEAALSAR